MSLAIRLIRALALLAAGLLPALAAEAAHPSSGKDTPPSAIYHNYCSVCHGDKGDGQSRARGSLNPPPRDFTTAQALSELTRDRMIAAVKGGVPGTAMVSWQTQLEGPQIEAVVDYVREHFMRASSQADASRGRQIYARTCSVCHGDRGTGSVWASANLKPAPRDFSQPQARAELSRERMLASVAAGRPGTAMTGFARQLNPADMEAVVDYIRGAFMRIDSDLGISGTQARGPTALPAPTTAAAAQAGNPPGHSATNQAVAQVSSPVRVDMALPFPSGLVGDLPSGRKFYDANCATCHGVKGDGQGPRAYFINPKPRNFVTLESRAMFNRPAIYAAVSAGKLGTEMPAWSQVLQPQEMANVAEYVFQAFMQPGAARLATRTVP
jgi:mono/diheme cytochrome c family protein